MTTRLPTNCWKEWGTRDGKTNGLLPDCTWRVWVNRGKRAGASGCKYKRGGRFTICNASVGAASERPDSDTPDFTRPPLHSSLTSSHMCSMLDTAESSSPFHLRLLLSQCRGEGVTETPRFHCRRTAYSHASVAQMEPCSAKLGRCNFSWLIFASEIGDARNG